MQGTIRERRGERRRGRSSRLTLDLGSDSVSELAAQVKELEQHQEGQKLTEVLATMREVVPPLWRKSRSKVKHFFSTMTIEPSVFLHIFSFGIILGAAVQTNLMLWKICAVVKGHDESVCHEMVRGEGNHTGLRKEAQTYLNDFEVYMDFIQAGPAVLYSLVAGAISDRRGGSRRPLMLAPMLGWTISFVVHILHYTYIREFPMWVFYIYSLRWIMGGQALYYQGTYLYTADVSKPDERTTRFGRIDGLVILSYMLGIAASPYVYGLGGYYLSCLVIIAFNVAAIFHLVFFVKDVETPGQEEEETGGHEPERHSFLVRYLWEPLKETWLTLTKKRTGHFRTYVFVLLVAYGVYYGTETYGEQIYLYMTLVFEGFDGTQFSTYNVYTESIAAAASFLLVPLLKDRLGLHETTMTIVILAAIVAGQLSSTAANVLWPEFYLARLLPSLNICIYACLRSLFVKLVAADEKGKIFSAVAILVALVPAGFKPFYRKLYNATIAVDFPSAFLLVSAALYAVVAGLCAFLWFNRERINEGGEGKGGGEESSANEKKIELDELH